MNLVNAYKLRTSMLFLFFCFLYTCALITLFSLQVRQHAFFKGLAQRQYYVTRTIQPPRAAIYDRNGKLLAMNRAMISAFVLPKQLKQPEQLRQFLAHYFPDALQRLDNAHDRHFIYVQRHLTPAQQALIQEHQIVDINLIQEPGRYYPLACAGPVVGITDQDNNGIMGIELQYNEQLAGTAHIVSLQKDARSGMFYFEQEVTHQGSAGTPVTLTIDSDIQFIAHQELKHTVDSLRAREGAALVINPVNGQIIAMVRYPDFDPNNRTLIDSKNTRNIIVTDGYELGSVIKACAGLAALEEKVTTPDERIDCKGTKSAIIDGIKVNTWAAHDTLTFAEIIQKSNNIGMVQVTKRVGKKLYDYYKQMGFCAKTGIEFPGEHAGFMTPPDQWSRQSIYSLSYGYELNATLLQLARFFGMLATGYLVKPTLLLHQSPVITPCSFSSEAREQLSAILAEVTTKGTAHRARLPGYSIRIKTGTANLIDDNGLYNPDRNIFTAAAIVQKNDYLRIIITFVKEVHYRNMYASQVGVPLLAKIAERMLIHDHIIDMATTHS